MYISLFNNVICVRDILPALIQKPFKSLDWALPSQPMKHSFRLSYVKHLSF